MLLKVAGKDASKQFDQFHNLAILEKFGPDLQVGVIGSASDAGIIILIQLRQRKSQKLHWKVWRREIRLAMEFHLEIVIIFL